MRIVFMGTPEFAAVCLRALAAGPYRPVLAVSQPDRPAGRGRRVAPTPVARTAAELALPLIQPAAVRTAAFAERLSAARPDVIVTAAYGRILTPAVLAIPSLAAINVHASLLPRWRGAAPVAHALLAGDRTTGVTTFRLVEELDAGEVYLRRELPVPPEVDAGELTARLAPIGAELALATLAGLERGDLTAVPQDPTRATWAPPLAREDGWIDWGRPVAELADFVRGMNPWPGALTLRGGERLQVRRAAAVAGPAGAPPGTVVRADPRSGLAVAAGGGLLVIERLVPAGRREQSGAEFVRGARPVVGECWTSPARTP